jgi:transposase
MKLLLGGLVRVGVYGRRTWDRGFLGERMGPQDKVALEVTGNAWEIARILEPHVARAIVVSPGDTGIRQARAKTDRLDALALAKLLATGSLDTVWVPDERNRIMRRRLARRRQLVAACTRAKNEIHAVLMRRLKGRPPARSATASAAAPRSSPVAICASRATTSSLRGQARDSGSRSVPRDSHHSSAWRAPRS